MENNRDACNISPDEALLYWGDIYANIPAVGFCGKIKIQHEQRVKI